jgi:hypothetical protein
MDEIKATTNEDYHLRIDATHVFDVGAPETKRIRNIESSARRKSELLLEETAFSPY